MGVPSTGFKPHLLACAVGAGLDNLFRQVVMVALGIAALKRGTDAAHAQAMAQSYSSWVMVLTTVPFLVFAPFAGSLGDRLPKHCLVRWCRLADVPVCALGIWGFASGSVPAMLVALTGLAVASSFFAPVKLAIVPELVPPQALGPANSALAGVTVSAILLGTCLAAATDTEKLGYAVDWWATTVGAAVPAGFTAHAPALVLALISLLSCGMGIAAAYRLPALRAQAPDRPLAMPWQLIEQIRAIGATPGMWAPAISLAGFWGLGVAAIVGLVPIAESIYGCEQAGVAGLFLVLVAGVIVGSVSAPRLMSRAFPAGLPIFGALLAGASFVVLGLHAHHDAATAGPAGHPPLGSLLIYLFTCGVGAGWWEVPLTILVQERAPAASRNLAMSGVSALGCVGQIVAAAAMWILADLTARIPWCVAWGAPSTQSFIALGAVTIVLALGFAVRYRLQLAAWLMTSAVRRVWRVRVRGAEHVPPQGGCLVVCNHLSFADGVIMASSLPRPGRFLVYRKYVEMPVVGFLLRAGGVIPVAAEDRRRALIASIDTATEAAKSGECVVIFPEGKLTRSGQMDSFRGGMERIASRAGVPVVPAFLHGLWGGPFSRAATKDRPRWLRRVDVFIAPSLESTASAAEARARVSELANQHAVDVAQRDRRTLGEAALISARRRPFADAVRDAGGVISRWKLAAVARVLIPHLGLAADERCVGVMLPPGRGGAIVNLALALAGRTAVNLNHTAGPAQLARMCELAGIRTVISSQLYLRKIGDPAVPGRVLHAEELLPKVGKLGVILAAIGNWLLPASWRARGNPDDTAAIVFSSGSTGDPKGVELTHRQILANCRSVREGLGLHLGEDTILSPLPLFHSFGLVPGFWLGLVEGFGVAAQPDPTDGKALSELCKAAHATFMISTPTFVRGYLRRGDPEGFKSLRFAVVGAEKCPPDLRKLFKEKVGSDLLEGYGCTELAPVVCTNLPDVASGGETDRRTRDGSVGRALPGQHAFTVDPETLQPLPPGKEGLIVVRSPARMKGYLGRPDLTEKAFVAGGYATGDIGRVDDDGFIFITGRLARFAKVGGEMVPLDNVEAALQTVVGEACELAVAAVADTARGERLVILHTEFSGSWETIIASLESLPPLWRPKPRDAKRVEAIPKLGTGKRDLAGIKRLAADDQKA